MLFVNVYGYLNGFSSNGFSTVQMERPHQAPIKKMLKKVAPLSKILLYFFIVES